MARKNDPASVVVFSRLLPVDAQRLQKYLARLNARTPGAQLGRSDAIRILILSGIDADERAAKVQP